MRIIGITLIIITLCFAYRSPIAFEKDGEREYRKPSTPSGRGTLIDELGDFRALLGSEAKNITVCQHGVNVAVIYPGPTNDPENYLAIRIGYSVDSGATWTTYGPFAADARWANSGVDGSPNFCTNPGELYFAWHQRPFGYLQGFLYIMIEEGTPSAPSPQVSVLFDGVAYAPCASVSPDDPNYVIVTAWFLDGVHVWITNDGGYTWSDTVNMSIDGAPHVRIGNGGYVFATYQEQEYIHSLDTTILYPYYIESTDGGYTWINGEPLPVPCVTSNSQFEWYWAGLDCEVVNNEPWTVHTDLGIDSMWLFHGTGSPGNWDWTVLNIRQLGAESLWTGDTLYYCYPSMFPNVSYEPLSNTILVSYKAYYLKVFGNHTVYNGAHIGGVYSTDNGSTWTVSNPLSESNVGEIAWDDWCSTEVAHSLVNVDGNVYSYGIWVHEGWSRNLYFERGVVRPFLPLTIEENDHQSISKTHLQVLPTINTDYVQVTFNILIPDNATIILFDVAGRLVDTIFAGYLEEGIHTVDINSSKLANGIYFVALETDVGSQAAKFIVAR